MTLNYRVCNINGNCFIEGTEFLSYNIEYLRTGIHDLNNIFLWIALLNKDYVLSELYLDAVNSYLLGSSALPHEYICKVTVTKNKNCIFCGYFDQYSFTGGAHGNTIRTAFNYEIVNNCVFEYRLQINRKKVISQIIQQIRENDPSIYFENFEELVNQYFNENQFYATGDGIVVFFNLYEIAPYYVGIPTFEITLN